MHWLGCITCDLLWQLCVSITPSKACAMRACGTRSSYLCTCSSTAARNELLHSAPFHYASACMRAVCRSVGRSVCCCRWCAGSKAASPFPDGSGSSAHDPYWAVISEVRELHTAASDRSCVHVEIDISGKRCGRQCVVPISVLVLLVAAAALCGTCCGYGSMTLTAVSISCSSAT